jgi:hypothetical protein
MIRYIIVTATAMKTFVITSPVFRESQVIYPLGLIRRAFTWWVEE